MLPQVVPLPSRLAGRIPEPSSVVQFHARVEREGLSSRGVERERVHLEQCHVEVGEDGEAAEDEALYCRLHLEGKSGKERGNLTGKGGEEKGGEGREARVTIINLQEQQAKESKCQQHG